MEFLLVLSLVAPVFGLALIGGLFARLRLLSENTELGLTGFATRLAVPALFIKVISTGDLPAAPPWALWFGYFGGVAVVFAIAMVLMIKLFGRELEVGIIGGVSAGFANTVMVGVPVISAAFGPEGLVVLTLLVSVHLPVMILVTSLLFASANRSPDRPVWMAIPEAFWLLARNSFVIGICLGFLARLFDWQPSGAIGQTIDMLAGAAIPCALVALGMSLNRYGLKGNLMPAIVLSALKLFVMPVVVYVLMRFVLDLPTLWVQVMTLTAASSTGINAYLIAGQFGRGMRISASTITITSAAMVVTMTLWLSFLKTIGG